MMEKKSVKHNIGLWLDRRRAVIVSLGEKGHEIHEISSHAQHVRVPGGEREAPAEDQRERKFKGQLHKYYDKVVSLIRGADSILILGPGEAKVELRTRLESEALGGHIVGIETVDKMTDPQIAAKVREHFSQ